MTDSAPWAQPHAQVLEQLAVDPARGLDPAEARARLSRHGPNVLRGVESLSAWEILLNQLKSLIVALLVAAAVLSAAFGDWIEAAAIGAVLVVNTLIGFLTELRAVRSMEALRELGEVQARVRRGGQEAWVPAQELVPGDVTVLEGGDVVTADLRLIEGSKLKADESVLTGESLPVGKDPGPCPPEALLAERRNMLFKGTALSRGSGVAVVTATGMATELGKIAALVAEAQDHQTPLEQRLERLGRRLVVVALVVAAVTALAGIVAGKPVVLMVETGIALAVAAIPEGLPVVATMALARGMWRLAQRDALIRELAAVETLGATSVILTDKTGTLTENRMTVTRLVLGPKATFEVTGRGLQLSGSFHRDGSAADAGAPPLRPALEVSALCNNASLREQGDAAEGLGDPLEVALLVVAAKAGLRRPALLEVEPELREEAFDPAIKMMATFHRAGDGVRVAVKGAAEAVLEASASAAGADGAATPLDDEARRWWLAQNEALASEGLRVLALAEKTTAAADDGPYGGLTFLGLVGMQDPPRAGVREAVAACRRAGVRVVMATGDQAATGEQIGRAVGLVEGDDAGVVSGADLTGGVSREVLERAAVFARVEPAQKLALVEAFQAGGAVVAMTGDGVNDAPALQKADIGVAMGQRGTQVAREAADMVLRDDSLDSIVVAIRQGRVIFENIRQFVLYLLSCNMAEIGVITGATLLGMPLPLLPLQILFLNLVTDVFPALALGFGEGDPGTMERPPRDPQEPFLTRRHWMEIGAHATVMSITVVAALAIALGPLGYERPAAVTISFLTLGFAQLWHVFNVRSPGSSFWRNDVMRNPHVWGALGLCSALLLATVGFTPLAGVLGVQAPDAAGWALVLGLSLVPWLLGQLSHALRRPA